MEHLDEKEARSDHHTRQGLRKPGDRAKKFNQKNAARPKGPQSPSSTSVGVSSSHRTHGKRVDFIGSGGANDNLTTPSPTTKTMINRTPSGGATVHLPRQYADDWGEDAYGDDAESDEEEYERELRERALLVSHGTESVTGTLTRGVDGIVLDETREAASVVPIEELLATAYAKKKPRKSKADQFDHIRGFGKDKYMSVAPRSVKSSRSKKHFPHEQDKDSDWESIGEDGTEAWEYNSEWRAEMGNIMGETLPNKTSYREAALAGVISIDGSIDSASQSATTDKTDDLP